MPVSEATAAKAVEAWGLEKGRVVMNSCGCRWWIDSRAPEGMREVRQCPAHRPSWLAGVITNADR